MHFILLWYYILLYLIYWLLAEIVILTFDLLEEYLEILNSFVFKWQFSSDQVILYSVCLRQLWKY